MIKRAKGMKGGEVQIKNIPPKKTTLIKEKTVSLQLKIKYKNTIIMYAESSMKIFEIRNYEVRKKDVQYKKETCPTIVKVFQQE
jgi:hypothetical protein